MIERIGLFGGSFNPIHIGHLIAARALREKLNLNQVYFLPSLHPPHKGANVLAESHHRKEMVRLAIEGEVGFTCDDFDLTRVGPCYTIETVAHFRKQFPTAQLYWFICTDSLMDLPTWHRAPELVANCSIVTAARSGKNLVNPSELERVFGKEQTARLLSGIVETPVIDISSTDVRNRVAKGFSIRFLVSESVRKYIEHHRLYRG